MMHLKDLRRGAPTGIHTGHAPPSDDVPLGTGQVNWPAVLKQAAAVGVRRPPGRLGRGLLWLWAWRPLSGI